MKQAWHSSYCLFTPDMKTLVKQTQSLNEELKLKGSAIGLTVFVLVKPLGLIKQTWNEPFYILRVVCIYFQIIFNFIL